MTLSKALRKKVQTKLGNLSERTLHRRIKKRAREEHILDLDLALLLIAVDCDIDIRKRQFNVPQAKIELAEKQIQSLKQVQPVGQLNNVAQASKGKRKIKQKTYHLNFGSDLKLVDPYLPSDLIKEAERMSHVYPMTYVFENSVRNFVRTKLESTYGSQWFDTRTNSKIKQKVKERMDNESKNRWHGKRNLHPIFYTDMEQLATIISANYSDFQTDFPDPNWAHSKIQEVTMSRNAIAHHNPLEQQDIDRLKVNLRDWIRQISV